MSGEAVSRLDNLVNVLNKVGPQFATPAKAIKGIGPNRWRALMAKLRCNSYRQAEDSK